MSFRIREKEAEIAYLNLQITEKMTYIGAVENEINELKRHKNKSAVFD